MYYIGFNANNAICNECFLEGTVTLNPNREKGNIYYTKKNIIDKSSDSFLTDYKKFLVNTMEKITKEYKNTTFLAFNKKIKELLKGENKFNILGERDYCLIDKLNDKKYSYRNLMNMRKFYLLFRDKKVNALRSQLSWSHYRELLSIKNFDEIII